MLFDLATAHLAAHRVVLPGVTVLARLIARIRERTGQHTYRQLAGRLTAAQRDHLEFLLIVAPGERLRRLEQLRVAPTRISGPALVAALQRLDQIRALGVGDLALDDLPQARLAQLAHHFASTWVQNLARLGLERRLATLLAGAQALERRATDDMLDLFDGLLTTLALRGEVKRRRERLRSLKDLDQAALVLQRAVRIVLDTAVPDTAVRAHLWQRIGESALREAASQALQSSYATVRRFLPALLRGLRFEGTPVAKPLLDAWRFLQQQELAGRGRPRWTAAPRTVIPKAWARRVFPAKDEVNQAAYTLCVLDRLHQALRRREVFAPVSERYGDPRAELLQGEAWESAREAVARALDRSTAPHVELTQLQAQVRTAYEEVGANINQNTALEVRQENGQPYVVVTPLVAQPESEQL